MGMIFEMLMGLADTPEHKLHRNEWLKENKKNKPKLRKRPNKITAANAEFTDNEWNSLTAESHRQVYSARAGLSVGKTRQLRNLLHHMNFTQTNKWNKEFNDIECAHFKQAQAYATKKMEEAVNNNI